MLFPQFLAICLINLFCFPTPVFGGGGIVPHHNPVPGHVAPLAAQNSVPHARGPELQNAGSVQTQLHFNPKHPLPEYLKKLEPNAEGEYDGVVYEEDKPSFPRHLLQNGENAAKYAINLINNCPYNIFVKAYTAIATQHVQDGGNLAPGKKGQINVPNNYNDVEIFPLKNCKGAGGTQCESGGCKSNPNEHGKCKVGEGHESQVRFDLRNGKNEAVNCYAPLNGFNVPASIVPHKSICPKLSVTAGAQQTVNCDQSGGYTITYCP